MTSKLEKNTSEISAMKGEIALKVEQTDIENAKNEINDSVDTKISSAKAEITVETEKISQSVSKLETTTTELEGKVTNQESRLSSAEQKITDKAITSVVQESQFIKDMISQSVSKLETTTTELEGKVTNQESRLSSAEQKITDKAITSVVQESQFIKDMDGKISTNKSNISKVEQTASSISSKVSDLSGKYTEIKQTVDGIDVTGKVSFSDLSTGGRTTINGSNITTGTINTNRVNIKGGTTKKIVIANDNYCVYDGSETDVNRKVFMGFRTNTATNVPSVMLGYNGINPAVDGAVISGGTYTTYSHYPNNNNPEGVNLSYGALAFKYGAGANQFSTLNMYQNGDIDLKSGASMYFRPNLRGRGNHVFAITDTSVGSRVPFQCTSTIYSNGDITTDRGLYSTYLSVQGDAGVSNKLNASKLITNRIDVYGDSNLDGNTYVSGSCTIGNTLNVRNKPIYGMGSITLDRGTIYLPQGGGNTTTDYVRIGFGIVAGVSSGNFHFLTMNASPAITLDRGTIYLPQGGGNTTTDYVRIGFGIVAGVSSGNFHFLTMNASPANLYASNVRSAYSLEPNSKISDISALEQIDAINVVNTSEGLRLSSPNNKFSFDESKVVTKVYNEKTNQEEINVDYNCAISTLWKAEGLRLSSPNNKFSFDESKVVTKVYNEKTNQEEINVDYNCAISTLWKAVQELKSEVDSLKQENNELKLLLNKGD